MSMGVSTIVNFCEVLVLHRMFRHSSYCFVHVLPCLKWRRHNQFSRLIFSHSWITVVKAAFFYLARLINPQKGVFEGAEVHWKKKKRVRFCSNQSLCSVCHDKPMQTHPNLRTDRSAEAEKYLCSTAVAKTNTQTLVDVLSHCFNHCQHLSSQNSEVDSDLLSTKSTAVSLQSQKCNEWLCNSSGSSGTGLSPFSATTTSCQGHMATVLHLSHADFECS